MLKIFLPTAQISLLCKVTRTSCTPTQVLSTNPLSSSAATVLYCRNPHLPSQQPAPLHFSRTCTGAAQSPFVIKSSIYASSSSSVLISMSWNQKHKKYQWKVNLEEQCRNGQDRATQHHLQHLCWSDFMPWLPGLSSCWHLLWKHQSFFFVRACLTAPGNQSAFDAQTTH